jgi:hypothetical protein
MVRAQHSGKTAPQPPESPRKHRKCSPVQFLKFIEQLKKSGKEAHLKATNTRKCYAGHVKCGREWLAEYFKDERSSKELPWLSLLQTYINFPRFLPIFPDFLERLSHLAPIY